MKTRSVTNKENETESGYDSRHPRTFEDPPRSPSTIASAPPRTPHGAPTAGTDPAAPALAIAPPATAAAGRVAPTTSNDTPAAPAPRHVPASRATATAHDYGELLATPSVSRYPPTLPAPRTQDSARTVTAAYDISVRDTASTIRSRRSYSSDVTRVKKAEYEAQKRIAAIRNEQLELEKALVNKRLEYEVSTIEAEAEAREEGSVHMSEDRVDEWLQSIDRSHPPDADRLRTEQPPRPAVTHAAPRTAAYVEPATYVDTAAPTRSNQRRQRSISRSPTRGERRVGRGIEQLADTLEKMMHVRPPPRQVTELPTFTGAAIEWLPFKAAYNDSSSLCRFTATENLARLRNCIKGEAREAVSALLYSASDPQVIMKTLEQYYGRPEILMDRVMEDLKKLPRLTGAASELNSFAVKLQNIVCVISKMDNRGYIWNPMLTRDVVEKLSPHIKSRWCDYASETVEPSREPEVILLSRFLMREADRAMRYAFTNTAHAPASKKETKSTPQFVPKRKSGREAVFATAEEEERKPECLCCGGNHEVPKCAKFLRMSINERWDWVRTSRLCFKCVTRRHRREHCRAKRCGKGTCSRPHHVLLHQDRETKEAPPSEKSDKATDVEKPRSQEAVMTVSASSNPLQRVLLKMCPVIVSGPQGETKTYALLDEGATITLVDKDLAESVGAKGPSQPLQLNGVNMSQQETESQLVTLQVKGLNNEDGYRIRARTMKNLRLHQQSIPDTLLDYEHLRDLTPEEVCYERERPGLLVGTDHWECIVSRELRTGEPKQPAASRTALGWVVHGTAPSNIICKEGNVLHLYEPGRTTGIDNQELHDLVDSHFRIDALGIQGKPKVKDTDLRAMDIVKNTIKKTDTGYEVGLPWRRDDVTMPPSYGQALRRLKKSEQRMDADAEFAAEYSKQINNLVDKGYAELCDGSEEKSAVCWYLPHFAVQNPNKPGKHRLVFDAAAKSNGVCLNDELLEGPDLLLSLPGILFRFRERTVAVTADVQEMFLRIKIRPEDQPAQQFLWRGSDREKPPKRYKMTSMIFGAASSPYMAHYVRNHNADVYGQEYPRALEAIKKSHYMDDLVASYENSKEAWKAVEETRTVHAHAGFILRGWSSSDSTVLRDVPAELHATTPTQLGGEQPESKILGLHWNAARDELGFNTSMNRVPSEVRARTRAPTKREALSAVMSIYDPLGLLSHYTIRSKIILQQLWRLQITWDEQVPEEENDLLASWLARLSELAELRLPRCYIKQRCERIDLHILCDASEQAYATVAYWRIANVDGSVNVVLVAAKAKVAPRRAQTIPRLELQAAVIGARLADTIKKEHRIDIGRTTYWTDSTTVVHWIHHDMRRYTPFVAHRLGEIAELTKKEDWRWLPTADNVADDATRLVDTPISGKDRWFQGPDFLFLPEEQWPAATTSEPEDEEVFHITEEKRDSWLPDPARFSKYEKLVRTVARVMAFADICRKKATTLEHRHIQRAEAELIRQAQEDSFGDEMKRIRSARPITKASRLYRLDPVLEDGILKVRGRIEASAAPTEAKRPIILDGRHQLTKLLVLREHCAAGHANRERVTNDLRQRYWIVHLRPTVRTVEKNCIFCRRHRATPRPPATGDLPRARLDPFHRPFTNCGVDYFGPMMVKVGRRREKRWGALFTCLTSRAVHLELVASLSTDSAIMALRRMAARRGWPRLMYSDNATNFRGADQELRNAYTEWMPALQDEGLLHRMEWRFIPPGAPNQGGAWERMVRSVKTALNVTLREKAPPEEVLRTLLTEAEFSINARPLTHVSVDPNDPEALTPNHFLLGSSDGLPATGPCDEADRRTWRASQALADHFWRRWLREYLPTLVPRGEPQNDARPLRNGDVVLIVDNTLPRNTWPMGIVERTHSGPDGGIRVVEVRTRTGTFRRPVSRLVVMRKIEEATQAAPGGGM